MNRLMSHVLKQLLGVMSFELTSENLLGAQDEVRPGPFTRDYATLLEGTHAEVVERWDGSDSDTSAWHAIETTMGVHFNGYRSIPFHFETSWEWSGNRLQ
jgi:hypothetical protein